MHWHGIYMGVPKKTVRSERSHLKWCKLWATLNYNMHFNYYYGNLHMYQTHFKYPQTHFVLDLYASLCIRSSYSWLHHMRCVMLRIYDYTRLRDLVLESYWSLESVSSGHVTLVAEWFKYIEGMYGEQWQNKAWICQSLPIQRCQEMVPGVKICSKTNKWKQ